jgi:hypothetical protein
MKIIMKDLIKLLPLFPSLLFALYLVLLDFTTFDYYFHINIAKHYKENWFSLINQKLSAGLDLSGYPPLIHQIIALLSFIFPLKASYYITLITFWVLISYFVTSFFLDYLKVRNKFWLVYLFVFFSTGILVTIFVFGQITTIAGLTFGFISLYYFNKFLMANHFKNVALASISLSLSAFSHHFSFLLATIFYLFIFTFKWKSLLRRLKGLTLFLICSFILVSIIYYSSISKAFTNSLIPQKEIPHWSRHPFTSSINFDRWLALYGLPIFMLLSPIFFLLSKTKNCRQFLEIYLVAMFFFVIGLGETTPFPKIFFALGHWLTYERFSLMSSIIFTVLFVLFIPDIQLEVSYKKQKINLLPIIFLTIFISLNIYWLFQTHVQFFGEPIGFQSTVRKNVTNYVLNFLNNVSEDYRYQTFGYGRPIGEIYLYSKLPTIDTDYFTGRTIDWIRNSGIDEIDQTRDKNFLEIFMNHTKEYSVKYIFTFDEFYHDFLKKQNWKIIESKNFDSTKVIIWENPEKVEKIKTKNEEITVKNYLWGVVPLLTLLSFLILNLKYYLKD